MKEGALTLSDYPTNMNMLGINANGLMTKLRNWFKGIAPETYNIQMLAVVCSSYAHHTHNRFV